MSLAAPSIPRNATRVRVHIPGRDYEDIERELKWEIRRAIGDDGADVSIQPLDEEADEWEPVIVVKQAHATWWTPLPADLAEMAEDYRASFTLRWREGTPKAGDAA